MFKNKSIFKLTGQVRLIHRDKDGNILSDSGWLKNTITNAGKAEVSNLMGNVSSPVAFTYLEVGTSSTAESASHTALQAAITDSGLARAAATVTRSTTTVTNDTLQLDKTWTASGSKTVEEIGVFNAASAGTMLGRKLTGSKALSSGDSLQATYKITVS
jgi:hypothetical protein